MHLKYEHRIYKEDFESAYMFKEVIQKKIELVESDLSKLERQYQEIEDMDNNSKIISDFQYDFEELIEYYKNTIHKLEREL